ncbi:MAG: murein L,D-transpeptidase family protein [Gemmobacter sp.]
MRMFRVLMAIMLAFALASCGPPSKFRKYHGPEVTQIVVDKGARTMRFYHRERELRAFPIGLGFAPAGHKQFEGDGKTPEGRYIIDRRNPDSRFHLSIGISYPNPADRAFAASQGKSPGGDIFIHGKGPRYTRHRGDWTEGCIWVTDREMEDIYAMVRLGTPIEIRP